MLLFVIIKYCFNYVGYVGGSSHEKSGGGSNYVCLTRNPVYKKYKNGFQGVSAITTSLVPCVTWTLEPLRWWFQAQTCVPRVGRANTGVTWWLNTLIITEQCTLVLTKILITSKELMPIITVHCFILSKDDVVPFLVNLMSTAVNWHAQCAPVNNGTFPILYYSD